MVAEEQQEPAHEMEKWLETLRGLDLTDPEVEAAAERLRAQRDRALPVLLAQFADPEEDAALLAVATVSLKGWAEPYPIEPLMALLRSPGVGALPKALIMTVLERYGIDVEGSGLFGVGVNLEDHEIEGDGGGEGVSRN
jgi:hypothetical protein